MTVPRDQLSRFISRREARLARLPWLRPAPGGRVNAWFHAEEMLVAESAHAEVEQFLHAHPELGRLAGHEQVIPGLRRYHVLGGNVVELVRAIHRARPGRAPVASPNHVFMMSPFNHGGPYGAPSPAAAGTLPSPADGGGFASISVVDTGLWRETPLPEGFLKKDEVDYETATDVDHDGFLDGDVGHANFIGGIYATHAPRSEMRILKALDTFGVCTETDLITQLGRVDDATHVVNLSVGGFTTDDQPPIGLSVALANLLADRDRVVVAAAGNDGDRSRPFWPAAFAATAEAWSGKVVAVAAHDGQQLCDWSNRGPWVSMAAPGADVCSTFIEHDGFPTGWATWNGTSFAAPRVGAAVAQRITAEVGPQEALAQVKAEIGNASIGGYPALL